MSADGTDGPGAIPPSGPGPGGPDPLEAWRESVDERRDQIGGDGQAQVQEPDTVVPVDKTDVVHAPATGGSAARVEDDISVQVVDMRDPADRVRTEGTGDEHPEHPIAEPPEWPPFPDNAEDIVGIRREERLIDRIEERREVAEEAAEDSYYEQEIDPYKETGDVSASAASSSTSKSTARGITDQPDKPETGDVDWKPGPADAAGVTDSDREQALQEQVRSIRTDENDIFPRTGPGPLPRDDEQVARGIDWQSVISPVVAVPEPVRPGETHATDDDDSDADEHKDGKVSPISSTRTSLDV